MAVVTGAIALLEHWVPVLSLGVLYVFAVLPVAVLWGLPFALPVAVACMLTFNWFFLAPRHTFSLADGENWFALAVYSATAVVVSELAASAPGVALPLRSSASASRRCLAELATELLRGREIEDELSEIATRAAGVLGVREAPSSSARRADDGSATLVPARGGGSAVGTIFTPNGTEPSLAVRSRFLPALAALLAVAVERERSSARRSRRRCFAAATSSRPRCYVRSRTTCARR